MTFTFSCDGCGANLPSETLFSTIYNTDNDVIATLCSECYKSVEVFLNNRMNEKGKGVNTGLNDISDLNRKIFNKFISPTIVPTNTPVNTNGEKKTGWTKGSYLDKQEKKKRKPRKYKGYPVGV